MKNKIVVWVLIFASIGLKDSLSQELNLLSNNFNDFFSEHDNQLWLASTENGFNRFNGFTTRHYGLNDSISGLEGTYIQSTLIADARNKLWTTTYEKLCSYDNENDRFTCRSLIINGDTCKKDYRVFYLNGIDKLWMRAGDNLLVYDVLLNKIHSNIGKTTANSFSIKGDTLIGDPWNNDSGFEIWINENNEWNTTKHVLTNCTKYNNIQIKKSLWKDESLWLLSNFGLILYDFDDPCNSELFLHSTEKLSAINCFSHEDSLIYLGTDNFGIQLFNSVEKNFLNSVKTKWEDIDYICSGSEKVLFYSNYQAGVFNIQKSKINSVFEPINILEENWKKVIKKNQRIILINFKDELYSFDLNTQILTQYGNDIIDADFLEEDYIVAGSKYNWKIIDLFNGKTKDIPHSWTQFQTIKIKNKKIFVEADNSIYTYKVRHGHILIEELASDHQKVIQALGMLSNESIAYAYTGTSFKINIDGVEYSYTADYYINDIVYSPMANKVFIATNNGLYSLSKNKNGKLDSLNTVVSSGVIKSLLIQNEDLYFNTQNRIGKYNRKEQSVIFSKYIYSEYRPAFTIDYEKIYTATDHVTEYSLKDFFKESKSEVAISNFTINDEFIVPDESLVLNLSHDQNKISWTASIDNWMYAKLGKIQYQLIPDQEEWVTVENHSNVELPRLLPNKYNLKIRGISCTGNASEIKSYKININEPWHNTILAQLGFFLITGFFFYLIYRMRINQIQGRISIKEEIWQLEKSALQAQMNPHFIFNCLNSIQNFIMDNDKENAMDYLGRFAQLIRSNLNASLKQKITLFEEVNILDNYLSLEKLRLNNKFSYQIDFPNDLGLNEIFLPPMLIQPFVENAVIHGMKNVKSDGNITISISVIGSMLHVTVKDNGVNDMQNLETNHSHKSVGIAITNKRLAFINNTPKNKITTNLDITASGTSVDIKISLEDI